MVGPRFRWLRLANVFAQIWLRSSVEMTQMKFVAGLPPTVQRWVATLNYDYHSAYRIDTRDNGLPPSGLNQHHHVSLALLISQCFLLRARSNCILNPSMLSAGVFHQFFKNTVMQCSESDTQESHIRQTADYHSISNDSWNSFKLELKTNFSYHTRVFTEWKS